MAMVEVRPQGLAEARAALATVQSMLSGFDPALVMMRDAMELVQVFAAIENLGAAGKALATRRVSEGDLWRRKGYKSPAEWLARTAGTKVGDAIGVLETAEAMSSLEATTERFKAGALSPRQAKAVATAGKADPLAEQSLLDAAAHRSLNDLETKARQVRQAASRESTEVRNARLHAQRSVRTWTDDETGHGCGQWRLPPAEHAEVLAALSAGTDVVFAAAKAEGRVEPPEAYTADALVALARGQGCGSQGSGGQGSAGRNGGSGRGSAVVPASAGGVGVRRARSAGGGRPSRGPARRRPRSGRCVVRPARAFASSSGSGVARRWSGSRRDTKILVRVDHSALVRGRAEPGEVCEIAGIGPVPVAVVQEWMGTDAFKTAIVADGVDIRSVVHLGRRPLAVQTTALQWIHGNACARRGCTRTASLEIDHVAEWATTHHTTVDELAPLCPHDHDLKTFHGFTLGPLGPDGRRDLLPPGESHAAAQPPASTASPPTPGARPGVEPPGPSERPVVGTLFDDALLDDSA